MRVGLVCAHAGPTAARPPVGTPARTARARVAAELAGRGHDVRVYERRDDPDACRRARVDGYQVDRVPVGPPTPLRHRRAGAARARSSAAGWPTRWAGDWAPEVVHGHYWIGGLAAAHAVRETDIPVVQTFHSLGIEQLRHLGRPLRRAGASGSRWSGR